MKNIKLLTINATIAALYYVLTTVNPLSFGAIQLRISTLLLPMAFYVPQIKIGLVLGTAIGNMNSSLGVIDIFVGSVVTAIAVFLCTKIKNGFLQSLCYSVEAGIFVSLELWYSFKIPIMYNFITVGISCFIIYVIGFYSLRKTGNILNKYLTI